MGIGGGERQAALRVLLAGLVDPVAIMAGRPDVRWDGQDQSCS